MSTPIEVVHAAHVYVQIVETGECLRTLLAFVRLLFGVRVEMVDRDVVQYRHRRICAHCNNFSQIFENMLDSKIYYQLTYYWFG